MSIEIFKLNKRTHIISVVEAMRIDEQWVYLRTKSNLTIDRRTKKAIRTKDFHYFKTFDEAVVERQRCIKIGISQHQMRIDDLKKRLANVPAKAVDDGHKRHVETIILKCTACEEEEEVHRSAVPASERPAFLCVGCIEYERKRMLKHSAYTTEDVNSALHVVKFGRVGAITKGAKRGGKYLLSLKQDERMKITGKMCSNQYLENLFEL